MKLIKTIDREETLKGKGLRKTDIERQREERTGTSRKYIKERNIMREKGKLCNMNRQVRL